MSSESKKSKESTVNAAVNITHILDAANENFTKLVNESAKIQPQYAQAVSDLQQEYIDATRNAIQTTTSVQKQLVNNNTNTNFNNNVIFSETVAPYIQGILKQSSEFTDNVIRITDVNNELAINAINVLRENVKNNSKNVEAAAEYNFNVAKAWVSPFQRQ